MFMCNIQALILSRNYDQCHFKKKKMVKCQGQKVKYQKKNLFTRNMHVKYQRFSTHSSNVINKVKVVHKVVKFQGQGHLVKMLVSHGKFRSLETFIWKYQIKALELTNFKNVIRKVNVFKKLVKLQGQSRHIVRIVGSLTLLIKSYSEIRGFFK